MTAGEPRPGVGIDLIEVERLERALERRPGLAQRLFRPGELAYAGSRRRPAMHLAARFAAKEAAVKALRTRAIPLRDFEVAGGGRHAPSLRLHGAAADHATRHQIELDLSLTHTATMAAAVVQARPASGKD